MIILDGFSELASSASICLILWSYSRTRVRTGLGSKAWGQLNGWHTKKSKKYMSLIFNDFTEPPVTLDRAQLAAQSN